MQSADSKALFEKFRFVPDGSTTLADALFSFIKDEIAFGRLKAGETIPTIKELAAVSGLTFRVARGVVERLAREGYVKSRPRVGTVVLPRGATQVRGRVLFALPDVDGSSYHVTQIATAIRHRMSKAGYIFSSVVFSQDEKDNLAFLRHELSRSADIVIVMYSTPHVRECLREANMKCIFVYGDEPSGEDGWWIRFSSEAALSNFAGHCARTGVKRVMQVRFKGNECPDARGILAAEGVACEMKTIPRRDELGRYEGIERSAYDYFLAMSPAKFPDVFLFWDDYVAQGALTAFIKRGIRIPEDVKVVTLSNRGLGPVYSEPLTRFECDGLGAGEKVADFALGVLSKGRRPAVPVITPQYIFGNTFPY